MNPKITITVDAKNKAIASFDGISSVGAKVDVEVRGLPSGIVDFGAGDDWSGPSLRLRILDDDGNDIVRFPLEKKTSTKVSGGDQWTKTTASGADTYTNKTGTVVDFDTEGLREQFDGEAYDTSKSFGIILDSAVDKAEFAVGKIKIRQWLTASVDDPTVLPNWTEIQEKLNTVDAKVEKPAGSTTATITITNTNGVTTTATVKDGEDGESGVTDYDDLTSRPQIGGVTLTGNKTLSDIGAVSAEAGKGLSSNDYTTAEKTKLAGVATGATAVSASASGTATDEVSYITVNGVEKKLAGGGDMKHSDFSDVTTLMNATLNQVADKVNELIGLLKPAVTMIMAMFGLCAFGDLGPATQFGDVPPSSTLSQVVTAGGGGGGADTNAVNDLISEYDQTNLAARIDAKLDATWKDDTTATFAGTAAKATAADKAKKVTMEDGTYADDYYMTVINGVLHPHPCPGFYNNGKWLEMAALDDVPSTNGFVTQEFADARYSRLMTNDVENIATNNIVEYSPWTVGQVNDFGADGAVTNVGVRWGNPYSERWNIHLVGKNPREEVDEWTSGNGPEWLSKNSTTLDLSTVGQYDLIPSTSTRTATVKNVLGLAYAKDVPSTNGFIKAEADPVALPFAEAVSNKFETAIAEKVDAQAATNAAAAYFAANADYALTNLTDAVTLRSGEIGSVETNANFTVTLDFADNGRSGDCLLYVVNADAANFHTLTVAPQTLEVHGIGSDWLKIEKATTNLFMFSRVKTNTVIVSKQEIK